eukprot:712465-Amphidinium_carterae.1
MGIPDEELLKPSSVTEDDRCVICKCVFVDPRECPYCEHSWCYNCGDAWFKAFPPPHLPLEWFP